MYAGPESSVFIPISIGGYKPLEIRRENGGLLISGEIYSADGDLAHIDNTQFDVSTGSGFKPQRPDRHTLIVYDKWHNEALHIRFLNPRSISFTGVFVAPGHVPVTIKEGDMQIGGMHVTGTGSCAVNLGRSDETVAVQIE